MKNTILNASMNLIETNFPDCSAEQLAGIKYGLEGIYLSVTKIIVIFTVSLILNILKETLILLFLFNVLRMTAFGLHASKSWMCWISSSIAFIGGPLLCNYIHIPFIVLVSLAGFCLLNFILYAPADTIKRPIIKKKKRLFLKFTTLVSATIYFILLFIIKNMFLQNALVYVMIIQTLLIHPMIYKLFRLPYNNYKSYVFSK